MSIELRYQVVTEQYMITVDATDVAKSCLEPGYYVWDVNRETICGPACKNLGEVKREAEIMQVEALSKFDRYTWILIACAGENNYVS